MIFQAMFDCQGVQAFVIICNVDIWMSAIHKNMFKMKLSQIEWYHLMVNNNAIYHGSKDIQLL
jgi:hypothetical protein